MAISEEEFDSSVNANTLKEKTVIVADADRKDYVRITSVTKVKTGKHGAAKVMISGKNIRTNLKAEMSFSGGSKVYVVIPVKKTYVLVDFDEEEDCIYADPLISTGYTEMETLHCNEIEKDRVKLLLETIKSAGEDAVIQFATVSCPGMVLLEEIAVVGSKRSVPKRARE